MNQGCRPPRNPFKWLLLPSGSCKQTSHHLLPQATRPGCLLTAGPTALGRGTAVRGAIRKLWDCNFSSAKLKYWHKKCGYLYKCGTAWQLCHHKEHGLPERTTDARDPSCSQLGETPNPWGQSHSFVLNLTSGQKAQLPESPSSTLCQHSVSFLYTQPLF